MKRPFVLFSLCVLAGNAGRAQQVQDTIVSPITPLRTISQQAFGVGEHLKFDVGFSFIKAGEAEFSIPTMKTVNGHECFQIVATVVSTPTFSFFYKVDDYYETLVDAQGIFPRHFIQRVREGKYSFDFSAEFDQENNTAITAKGRYHVPPYVHDAVSALFYVRTMDFSKCRPGEKQYLYNFYSDSTYQLAVKFLGYQQVEVKAGTFNCICVEPLVQEGGLFKSNGKIIIWMTNDERKIPVKVSTKVIVGSIDAELREYSGIRGTIKAKVED
jgi:hypothetical protein